MQSLPHWFQSFFRRTPPPSTPCKIYIHYGGRDPIVVTPANGMSEMEFRQLNGPVVFERSEVETTIDMGLNGLLRLDFRVIPHAVWMPLMSHWG